tara:strand:- start:7678 stop:7842 length:165 start_codon:yes stop_codon:yes gene_type:complete
MSKNTPNNVKNLKINSSVHALLKKYCNQNGLKMFKFVEKLISEHCKEKKDVYGE